MIQSNDTARESHDNGEENLLDFCENDREEKTM